MELKARSTSSGKTSTHVFIRALLTLLDCVVTGLCSWQHMPHVRSQLGAWRKTVMSRSTGGFGGQRPGARPGAALID
eukprot:3440551-Prymnesium_polylepis.2